MTVAHIGVGLFAIGVTVDAELSSIEKDIALRPGREHRAEGLRLPLQQHEAGRRARTTRPCRPNVTITRGDKLVATLHPQKRVYRVQRSPMTEAGIEVDWNRDLFVAMGEDLGDGAWSVRLQYKPMVRFIWLGALVMALGGLIAHHRSSLSHAQVDGRRVTLGAAGPRSGARPPEYAQR